MNAVQVIAFFDSVDEANDAARSLEQAGVDALYVRVTHHAPVSEETMVVTDRARVGRTFQRAVIGGAIGAVAGLLIGGLIALYAGSVFAILVSGFIFGSIVGGFYAVAVDLSVNPDIEDTLAGVEPTGPDAVEYFGPPETADRVSDVLAKHEPRHLVRM